MEKIIGVLGGMGPLATAEFMKKVIMKTPAQFDQEHIPMLIRNVPQVPDRTNYLMGFGSDPFAALNHGFGELLKAGATCIVIPCNTAHHWYERLTRGKRVHTISIIESVVEQAVSREYQCVGILATDATIQTNLYQSALEQHGIKAIVPGQLQQASVMEGIKAVKAGDLNIATNIIEPVFDDMVKHGADAVIFGCTEIPVALEKIEQKAPEKCLDSLGILAQKCVLWAKSPA
ncbi:aspartate racemase [Vibrio nigripulchritudo ATCC 27043]|uniref:aspartate/glutamate racemase family protein n=1 Tax=Vibrio nigripulchritudo TaxID=28173 RepID=UPI00021C26C8|nr:amino acid racemase [Vibrio nigripulchritudo]EGU56264.1 aspartate racemase [Vibrio nigripulchritudo ATCC 27043]